VTTPDELMVQMAALQRRVTAAEGVLAIQAMKARYGELVDRRFAAGALADDAILSTVSEQAAALFTADGRWDGGPGLGVATGREAIAARLRDSTLVFARHFFVNPRITVEEDGARATGRWDVLSPCRRRDGRSYWMSGYEDDEYAMVDGAWLHRSMRLTTVFMVPVADGWDPVLA